MKKKEAVTTDKSGVVKLTDNLPITQETGIIQPVTITLMHQKFSKIQNRALICVVEKLQSKFHEMINYGKSFTDIQDKDVDSEESLSFRIDLAEFGMSPNSYKDLRDALRNLTQLPVAVPYIGKNSRTEYDLHTNFCDVLIPKDVYKAYVIITIKKEVAPLMLSLDMGYQNLYQSVILKSCKSQYSQRMYMLVTAFMKKRDSFIMKTQTFRELFMLEGKYKQFRQLSAYILDAASCELRRLCEEGKCDCYFEYEKIYTGRKKTGEPDLIKFIIKRSKLLETEEQKDSLRMHQLQFRDMLIRHNQLSEKDAMKYGDKITLTNYQDAINKLMDIYNYIKAVKEDPSRHVKSVSSYTKKALDNFFNQENEPTLF